MEEKLMNVRCEGCMDRSVLVVCITGEGAAQYPEITAENSTGYERFIRLDTQAFASGGSAEKENHACLDAFAYPQALSVIRRSREKWVLLLDGNAVPEEDLLFHVQAKILGGLEDVLVCSERSVCDGSQLRMPDQMESIPCDAAGQFPGHLLIRRQLLEEILENPRGVYFPNPILHIARSVNEKGCSIAGCREFGIIHDRPLNFAFEDRIRARKPARGEKKRILVLTHELSRTGAPIVLQEACINVLQPMGYELLVVSPSDGPIAGAYLQAGIPVAIIPSVHDRENEQLTALAHAFDMAIVNTNTMGIPVHALGLFGMPVLWWIHDAESGYIGMQANLPRRQNGHMRIYCVGEYAKGALLKYRPQYEDVRTLIYGVKDIKGCFEKDSETEKDKLVFVCSGSITARKGQDILCRAIELLKDETRRRCLFRFVGKVFDEDLFEHVTRACSKYPDNVEYCKEVPRERVYEMYAEADCIICASTDDPMPTFVAEGMMFGTPSICSENTGTAKLLNHGVDSFVYHNNDAGELAQMICALVDLNKQEKKEMSARARECFLREFELEGFKRRLLAAVEDCISIQNDLSVM